MAKLGIEQAAAASCTSQRKSLTNHEVICINVVKEYREAALLLKLQNSLHAPMPWTATSCRLLEMLSGLADHEGKPSKRQPEGGRHHPNLRVGKPLTLDRLMSPNGSACVCSTQRD